ncbi:putative lectin-domain receptor-like protein kinase family protein precursor [Iris pallida]|uniref:Lectin-domain receptor-like protein kinase family protein n=1 Tax=Iris pallida TaxID=29817 RepID=A0AAX6H750_IRIPA|nr:putative lectin-domain receptor-like protein kinase family protein precursor [Iris pallida]
MIRFPHSSCRNVSAPATPRTMRKRLSHGSSVFLVSAAWRLPLGTDSCTSRSSSFSQHQPLSGTRFGCGERSWISASSVARALANCSTPPNFLTTTLHPDGRTPSYVVPEPPWPRILLLWNPFVAVLITSSEILAT